jgi:hypothetical protein
VVDRARRRERRERRLRPALFDQGEKLKSADLPARFPFVLGKGLSLGGSLDVDGKSIMFRVTKLTWTTVSR